MPRGRGWRRAGCVGGGRRYRNDPRRDGGLVVRCRVGPPAGVADADRVGSLAGRHPSSVVEHSLGKGEVVGSNPMGGLDHSERRGLKRG